jgi:thiamine-phosphate pyrophosphorylase
LAVKADGLHVGQEDMPAGELKKMLPIDMILGCSIGNLEEARQAYKEGADYLGVGAMFATTTKASVDVIGLDKIKQIKKAVELPIVAIGGINKGNIKEVMEAGADAAAVISAVMGADDVKKATSELLNIIRGPESG